MKSLIILSAFLCIGISASAEKSIVKNDSALIKRMAKLEERVERNHKKIERLEKENAGLKQAAGKQQVKSNVPQKAVVTRRGSKQVVFE